jgi:hypothetical protein
MIPLFKPSTARKEVNKTKGDGELAKLANLNRLVGNVNTIVANGIPAAAPTLTYNNVGTLDSMDVSFNIYALSKDTYNSGGIKTVQSYYVPSVSLSNNPTLTSITFSDVIIFGQIQADGTSADLHLLTTISFSKSTTINSINLYNLNSLTTFNAPLISGSIFRIEIQNASSLASLNFSNITTIRSGLTIASSGVTSINFNSLQSVESYNFNIVNNNNLTSFSLPELVYVDADAMIIVENSNLTSLTIGTVGKLKKIKSDVTLSSNALNVTSVNGILALIVSLDGTNGTTLFGSGKTLDLSAGTNAAPTGQGLIDKATLIARGVDVITN